MQFVIDANILKKAIQKVYRGLSKDKNSILSNYHVNIKDNLLSITSANEITQTSTAIPIEGDIELEFLATPDLFDRLKALNGKITFELEGNLLTIKYGTYKTTATVYQSEGYPLELIDNYKPVGVFDSEDILEFLKASIARDKKSKDVFRGLVIEINQNKVNFVASDRSRLFWINKDINNVTDFYCIIGDACLSQLNRLLKRKDKVTILYKTEDDKITKIAFQLANTTIISDVISEQFPLYQRVLVEDYQDVSCITFDKASLENSLQWLLPFAKDDLTTIKMSIQDTVINLSAKRDTDTVSDIVTFNSDSNHKQLELYISGKRMLDFLMNIPAGEVYFYYKESTKPIELKVINDNVYIYVMMPIVGR